MERLFIEVVKAPSGETCNYTYDADRAGKTFVFDDGTLGYYDGKALTMQYMMGSPMNLVTRTLNEINSDGVDPVPDFEVSETTGERLDSSIVTAILEKGTVKDIVALRKEGLI